MSFKAKVVTSFEHARNDITQLQHMVNHLIAQHDQMSAKLAAVEKREAALRIGEKPQNFVAALHGEKFHTENCPFARNIKTRVRYSSKDAAYAAGLKPCSCVR